MARNGVEGGGIGVVFRDLRQPTISEFPQQDAWKLDASCRGLDPSVMYPDPKDRKAVKIAKEVCAHCKVRETCLDAAIWNNDDSGVRGGYGERERRKLKKEFKKLVASTEPPRNKNQ